MRRRSAVGLRLGSVLLLVVVVAASWRSANARPAAPAPTAPAPRVSIGADASVRAMLPVVLARGHLHGRTAAGGSVPIAAGGLALADIVLPDDATPAETTAARELASALEAMTGARFQTVPAGREGHDRPRLLVGGSPAARRLLGAAVADGLGAEEFVVRTMGRDLLLVGGRPRGTLYAVYSFLEDDLGCRWTTWYGDEGVPRHRDLTVAGLDRRDAPALAVRDLYTLHYSDVPTKVRFLARNRTQGPALAAQVPELLADYGGAAARLGPAPNGATVHTLFDWMPPEVHFAEHPEWFSLVGGRRVGTRQLCFSQPELRSALTDRVLEQIGRSDPGAMYSLSAMDVPGSLCECDECRALAAREGTPGAPLFDYLAELATAVAARYPEARLSTLAYRSSQSQAPPRTIVLPSNVVVLFAPIDADFAAPIVEASNEATLRDLEAWRPHARHLWVWYYPNTYGSALPMGNLHRLAADLRLFERLGVEGLFVEHDAPGISDSRRLADLQSWLLAKLMWEPDRDLDSLVADYAEHHYGPAAGSIRQYASELEAATADQSTAMNWAASAGQHRYLTGDRLLRWQNLFDRAEGEAGADGRALSHVQQARMSLDEASLVLWNRLGPVAPPALGRRDVIERYRATYARAAAERQLPAHAATLVAVQDEWLRWFEALVPPAPLPSPLDAVPPEAVFQFTPESARLAPGQAALVEDRAAAAGIAATMAPTLDPDALPEGVPANAVNMGLYDAATGRIVTAFAGSDSPIEAGRYALHRIGRTVLGPDCTVWLDWSWAIQFPDLPAAFDPALPARLWDVYGSLRFDGPAYGGGAAGGENRLYVDRIVLVAVP